MRFAKIVFYAAGAWGIAVLAPLYFLLEAVGRRNPPAVNHPEFYFGFLGVALAWQIAFFVIAGDPIRFRPMMLPAMLEKFGHVATMIALCVMGKMTFQQLVFNLPDLVLGALFAAAFLRTRRTSG